MTSRTGRSGHIGVDIEKMQPTLDDTTVELPHGEQVLIFDPNVETQEAYIAADRSVVVDMEEL